MKCFKQFILSSMRMRPAIEATQQFYTKSKWGILLPLYICLCFFFFFVSFAPVLIENYFRREHSSSSLIRSFDLRACVILLFMFHYTWFDYIYSYICISLGDCFSKLCEASQKTNESKSIRSSQFPFSISILIAICLKWMSSPLYFTFTFTFN